MYLKVKGTENIINHLLCHCVKTALGTRDAHLLSYCAEVKLTSSQGEASAMLAVRIPAESYKMLHT